MSYPHEWIYEKLQQIVYQKDIKLIHALFREYTRLLPVVWHHLNSDLDMKQMFPQFIYNKKYVYESYIRFIRDKYVDEVEYTREYLAREEPDELTAYVMDSTDPHPLNLLETVLKLIDLKWSCNNMNSIDNFIFRGQMSNLKNKVEVIDYLLMQLNPAYVSICVILAIRLDRHNNIFIHPVVKLIMRNRGLDPKPYESILKGYAYELIPIHLIDTAIRLCSNVVLEKILQHQKHADMLSSTQLWQALHIVWDKNIKHMISQKYIKLGDFSDALTCEREIIGTAYEYPNSTDGYYGDKFEWKGIEFRYGGDLYILREFHSGYRDIVTDYDHDCEPESLRVMIELQPQHNWREKFILYKYPDYLTCMLHELVDSTYKYCK